MYLAHPPSKSKTASTHLLLIPHISSVVNILLHPLQHLLLRIRHTHQHAALHLRRNAFFDRLLEHRAAEDDQAGLDVGAGVLEVVTGQVSQRLAL